MSLEQDVSPELARLSRLYSALSHVNRAIVRTADRDELFRKVCDAMVEQGGFRMAWIGWFEPSTGQLIPVASCGDDDGYLAQSDIFVDDRPGGQGPASRAFRGNSTVVIDDLLADAALESWHGALMARGFRSSAACPIRVAGRTVGVMSVYASRVGFFQQRELMLLEEVTTDVAFALENFARESERARAEQIARREQDFSSAIIESLPGIVYLYDDQRRFLRWNDNFARVTGYSASEIATMHPLDLFTDADRALVEARIADVFANGEAIVQASLLTKQGRTIPHVFTGKLLQFDGQQTLVGMGIDISERVQAEQALQRSEERYHSTLDSMAEGCRLLDFEMRYLYINEAAARHDRRAAAELLGRTMSEVWPGVEETAVFAMLKASLTERVVLNSEVEFTFPDQSTGWFDVRVQPVPEGIFVLSIDISARKSAEHALRESKDNLAATVEARTAELRAALVRAEAADRLKSSFLATMSHELRTPLNSIIGFTGIVLQRLAGPLTDEQARQLSMVRGSARHLLELINDVLDISKIEAGQMAVHPEPFDIVGSVTRVTESVRPMADKKNLVLVVQSAIPATVIVSDRRRVEQILLNLMNNAIKFTDRGQVSVLIEQIAAPGAYAAPQLRVQVEDTGIGIDESQLSSLFLPFHQLDSGLARQHEGTGLGLAICRRLATLLDGEITVSSRRDEGATFSLLLPMSPLKAHA